MPNPTDSSSFVPIATIPNYEQYTSTTVDFRRIPKDVHVIAFRFFGGSDVHKMYIDDIIVDYFYDESRSFKSTNDIHHPQTTKIIYNGKLYILRDGKVYTIFGTIVDNIVNSTL